ncbi:osmoprotectant transport system substrate-binding protein [Symbiobacterium terraclitae]|uniref:Osmoprotectant transport system substrate-binding protein n=1 Tax=Symbiobacterium terraclitae TaxID=557451 RepID=A0ABS4JSL1_9FIRM|nr:glycine betaine ABC transporter substrate-binding protein [Symbiobacterium terraclitae]MBP2017970.1 osmoprotectant transport system substrate-binding protein [Symbiobacterium terraclitae]
MLKRRIAYAFTALLLSAALLAGCGGARSSGAGDTVVVGSKDFTENILLGEIAAQLLESKTDLKVVRKLNLGGTTVNFNGLKTGDLTLYAEYDGTGYSAHLGHTEPITDPDALFDQVKKEFEEKFGLTWSEPLGLNNTYTLAVPRALAEQYNLKTYSDLLAVDEQLVFGTTNEFMGRTVDGYEPLVRTYGFQFKDVATMQTGLRYKAIENGDIQIMDAYATDGKLKEFDMVILEDDKNFFPPYKGAYVIRMDAVEAHPEILETLNLLGGKLPDETMQELNYRVEVLEEPVDQVARDFLKSAGLID